MVPHDPSKFMNRDLSVMVSVEQREGLFQTIQLVSRQLQRKLGRFRKQQRKLGRFRKQQRKLGRFRKQQLLGIGTLAAVVKPK